jgi:hypothetical protein
VEGGFDCGVGDVNGEGDSCWGALDTIIVDDIERSPCDFEHANLMFRLSGFDV